MPRKSVERIRYWRLIHNDLQRVADRYSEIVQEKCAEGHRTGIALDTMSAAVFRAFYHEAVTNFVGDHVLKDKWPERIRFVDKIMLLNDMLNLGFSKGEAPLQKIIELHQFRDMLAHGKPDIGQMEIEVDPDDHDLFAGMKSAWKEKLNPDFDRKMQEASDAYSRALFDGANLKDFQTVTRASGSMHTLR